MPYHLYKELAHAGTRAHIITKKHVCDSFILHTKARYVGVAVSDAEVRKRICWDYEVDNGTRVRLHVTTVKGGPAFTARHLKRLVWFTNTCVLAFSELSPITTPVNIHLVLTPQTKKHPGKHQVLTPKHVNSGMTQRAPDTEPHIYIYRTEDFEKVLVHELIHYFIMDLGGNVYDGLLAPSYCVNDMGDGKININEAYTETLACYVYILVCLIRQHKGGCTDEVIAGALTNAKTLFTRKASWLLRASGADITDETCPRHLLQTTHAFSYYVCKAALFERLSGFIDLAAKGNLGDFPQYLRACLKSSRFQSKLRSKGKRSDMGMSPRV
jgi:hypothetical protein